MECFQRSHGQDLAATHFHFSRFRCSFSVERLQPDPKTATDQLRRAASLCFASVKLASMLKHETLKPDIIKGKPLCMDQFKVLFGSSRQPGSHDCDDSFDDVHVYGDSSHGKEQKAQLGGFECGDLLALTSAHPLTLFHSLGPL